MPVVWVLILWGVAGGASAQCKCGREHKDGKGHAYPRVRTQAGKLRSPLVARLLKIRWVNSRIPGVVAGKSGREAKALSLKTLVAGAHGKTAPEKPAVLYVYDPAMSKRAMRELERKMFDHDDVTMASHFFYFFRVGPTKIHGPGFLILGGDGRILEALDFKAKGKKLREALARAFTTVYAGTLVATLGKFTDFLDRLERVEDHAAVEKSLTNARALWAVRKEQKSILAPPRKKKK